MLNDSQMAQLREEGYLRLGRVMSDGQLAVLQQRLDDLTQGRIRNEKIGFQLEKAARTRLGLHKGYDWFGPSNSYRKLIYMEKDPLFLAYFSHPTFCSIMRQLIGPDVFIYRAFGMLKPAHDGSALGWHRDIGGNNPDPKARGRYYTVWTAIDAANAENGALSVLPGSHRLPKLTSEEQDRAIEEMAGSAVLLNAEPGEAFLLDQFLLHSSGPNPSSRHRRAVTLIYHDARVRVNPLLLSNLSPAGAGFTSILQSGHSPLEPQAGR
mgnify:CR=1 FL=1